MNKILTTLIAGISALLIALPAVAQDTLPDHGLDYSALTRRPPQTEPRIVATAFHKLARKQPDFVVWARESQEYKDTPDPMKSEVRARLIDSYRSAFSLLTLQEPIVIEMPVMLSDYSEANKGFFIENFRPDTFLPVSYANNDYAIVPQGLMDKQWLGIPDANVARAIIDARTSASGKPLTMLLMMVPKYADGSSPAELEGGKYWLISAEITKMMLFGPDENAPALWQSDDNAIDQTRRQELLNLRQ